MLRGRQVGTVPEPPLFTGVRKKMTEEKRSKKIYVLWPFNFKVMLILYVVQNMYNKWPLTSNVLY